MTKVTATIRIDKKIKALAKKRKKKMGISIGKTVEDGIVLVIEKDKE